MTQTPPTRDARLWETAARTAAAHTAASRDLETFLRRLPAVLEPADFAEYANLLAHEQAFRIDRDTAMSALGLTTPSIEPE